MFDSAAPAVTGWLAITRGLIAPGFLLAAAARLYTTLARVAHEISGGNASKAARTGRRLDI
jgi:hypothetical protein